ncbi:MAG TPA: urate hydroxylase PuuD [bacterium]|nr:urate hydroxylase PuuD [bacterium]
MQISDILQSIFRWFHIVAGILWIGLLYYFNFVNGAFAATMDGETKKKVVPQLMPRALYWFRWGAAWTWVTGLLLAMLVFYHGGALFEGAANWQVPTFAMIAVTFFGVFIYDIIMKTLGTKNLKAAVVLLFLLLAGTLYLMGYWAGWSYRGYTIHIGAMLGTIMAFNVWFRIWPSQKQIITAVRDGQAPDPKVVALAGLRSRQNTYMSVPLIWTMINAHTTWASTWWWSLLAVIVFGWFGTYHLLKKATKVPGF